MPVCVAKKKAAVVAEPEYYKAIHEIVDALSVTGDEKEKKRDWARKKILLYSEPEIMRFVEEVYPPLEVKRQRDLRRRQLYCVQLFAI